MTKTIFAERLIQLIGENNESYNEICNEIDMDNSTFSKLLSTTRWPHVKTVIKLAKYYGVSTDYLLGLKDTRN